ncbi:unnamed protein product [Phytophthora lilii]|uniref:Unnamed protein product n=1 Tax=Phytophthora lilii TaxID=2077276 RepID=A0A9W6WR39_9STRA|nr:unnamed protein product [Phytophthora lilii]
MFWYSVQNACLYLNKGLTEVSAGGHKSEDTPATNRGTNSTHSVTDQTVGVTSQGSGGVTDVTNGGTRRLVRPTGCAPYAPWEEFP